MALFDFFRKSKNEKEFEKFNDEVMDKLFPRGKKQLKDETNEISNILVGKYDDGSIANLFCYSCAKVFMGTTSKSELVDCILKNPKNKLNLDDATKMAQFAVAKIMKQTTGITDNDAINEMLTTCGFNNERGCTTDEIPEGYGEFGLEVTNPVPVNSIPASSVYLKKLRTIYNKEITWKRLGSTNAENISKPIDIYSIYDINGKQYSTIYISPYQNVISNKAPKGFIISNNKNIQTQILKNEATINDNSFKNDIQTFPYKKPSSSDQFDKYRDNLSQGLQAAGYYLQKVFKERNIEFPEVRWLQTSLTRPAFHHLSFAYKNQIFCILIELVDNNNYNYLISQDLNNLIKEAKQNSLIPCIIPLKMNSFEPLINGCHLINAETRIPIEINDFTSDELIELSNWELNNLGVSIVLQDLEKEGKKITSYCDVLHIEPQIWFEEKGKLGYVIVDAKIWNDDNKYKVNHNLMLKLVEYDGFYAKVGVRPFDDSDRLFRGMQYYIDYKGLIYIENVASKNGIKKDDIFDI